MWELSECIAESECGRLQNLCKQAFASVSQTFVWVSQVYLDCLPLPQSMHNLLSSSGTVARTTCKTADTPVRIEQYLMGRLLHLEAPLSTRGERYIARILGPMLSGDCVGTRSHL